MNINDDYFFDNDLVDNDLVDKNKIFNHKKKILSIEQKYIISSIPQINLNILNDMIKKISNYILVVKILHSNPDFYSELKCIQIDYFRKPNEVACLETIWNVEHYEYIESIKNVEFDIFQLIKFATKYNLISYVQSKYIKKMIKEKINLIFESDKSLENFYIHRPDIKLIVSETDLKLFFDILDIVIIKINSFSKSNKKITNVLNLSNNIKYTNLIKKIKLNLEKIN